MIIYRVRLDEYNYDEESHLVFSFSDIKKATDALASFKKDQLEFILNSKKDMDGEDKEMRIAEDDVNSFIVECDWIDNRFYLSLEQEELDTLDVRAMSASHTKLLLEQKAEAEKVKSFWPGFEGGEGHDNI